MGGDSPETDSQCDTERPSGPFHAVMTVVSSDPEEQTFVANFHRSGGITVETASFKSSDLAAGVELVVGHSYRSVGTLGNPRIRPLTEEDKRELFHREIPPEVVDALDLLRRLVAASKR